MAIKKLKLSGPATEQLQPVRQRLRLDGEDKFWTLRIAFACSLQLGHKFKDKPKRPLSKDGFQVEVSTIEQEDGVLFRVLLQQHYNRSLNDEEYSDYLLWHTEHGLNVIFDQTQSGTGDEYLIQLVRSGVDSNGSNYSTEKIQNSDISGYEGVLTIRIGLDATTSDPININFNKTDEHSNNYIGIAGKSGSGKTYFAKHILTELRKSSNYKMNFIIFDYAKGDIADDTQFTQQTRATVLRVDKEPIPINLFINSKQNSQEKFTAERIVQIIRDVEANIGKVQENNLYDAIIKAYDQVNYEKKPYPDFYLVKEMLDQINEKADSLTSVFRPLTEHNLFATRDMPIWDSLVDKTVIFDIHRLPALKDLCVFFVLNEIYRQLMLLPDSEVNHNTNAREMRTIVVIDEAHHFLKVKKRVKILENMIREIRSKGASVMLLTQSPDDYDTAEFDFLELLEFVYILQSNSSTYKFLQQSFGLSQPEAKRLINDVTELHRGEAFGKTQNSKYTKILLCK